MHWVLALNFSDPLTLQYEPSSVWHYVSQNFRGILHASYQLVIGLYYRPILKIYLAFLT